MDSFEHDRKSLWTGSYSTFLLLVAHAAGAVRAHKHTDGKAPICVEAPGREADPTSWWPSEGATEEQAKQREADIKTLTASVKAKNAAHLLNVKQSTEGGTSAKNAAVAEALNALVAVEQDRDTSRRRFLADVLASRVDPTVLADATDTLTPAQKADGIAVLLRLRENASKVGVVSHTEAERDKLSALAWTSATLSKHITVLKKAFQSFKSSTGEDLTQAQMFHYLHKSILSTNPPVAQQAQVLMATIGSDAPFANVAKWLHDNNGTMTPSGGDAPPVALMATGKGCVDCGAADHEVGACPLRSRGPSGGFTPRLPGEEVDPTTLAPGVREARERMLKDPETYGSWCLTKAQLAERRKAEERRPRDRRRRPRTPPARAPQEAANLITDGDDIDAVIDAWGTCDDEVYLVNGDATARDHGPATPQLDALRRQVAREGQELAEARETARLQAMRASQREQLERERAVRSAPPTQPSNVAGTTPSGLARNSFWTAAAVAMIAALISLGYYLAIGKPPYGLAAYAPPTHDTDCAAYASAGSWTRLRADHPALTDEAYAAALAHGSALAHLRGWDHYAPKALLAHEADMPAVSGSKALTWVCDSGATCSCCNDESLFIDMTRYPNPRSIGVADGSSAQILGIGTVRAECTDDNGRAATIEIRQCRFVPAFRENLLAIMPALKRGVQFHLEENLSYIGAAHDGSRIPVDTTRALPTVMCTRPHAVTGTNAAHHVFSEPSPDGDTVFQFHALMAHVNLPTLIKCVELGHLRAPAALHAALKGAKSSMAPVPCHACALAKLQPTRIAPVKEPIRRPDAASVKRPGTTRPCERWSADWMDCPYAVTDDFGKPTGNSYRYCLVTVDHDSGQYMTYFARSTTEGPAGIAYMVEQSHVHGLIPDINACDLELTVDTELYNSCAAYCDQHGIRRRPVSPGDHRFNRAEVAIRVLRQASQAMRLHAQLPGAFTVSAVNYAAFLHNMIGRPHNAYVSPFERAYGFVPSTDSVVEYGAVAAVLVKQVRRGDPKAIFALHVGPRQPRQLAGGFPDPSKDGSLCFVLPDQPNTTRLSTNYKVFPVPALGPCARIECVRRVNRMTPPSRAARLRARADMLAEAAADAANDVEREHVYVAAAPRVFVPASHNQAIKCKDAPLWIASMSKEISGQFENGAWDVVDQCDCDPTVKVLPQIWAFKYKPPTAEHPDGICKSRLCPNGSLLTSGVDFDEHIRSSPVADRASVRVLLALCAMRCLKLECADLCQAYLQQRLPKNSPPIYARCPPGFVTYGRDGRPQRWRARAPVYGIPWAGNFLYKSLADWLRRIGARPTLADPCVWVWDGTAPAAGNDDDSNHDARPAGQQELLVAITVDDLVFGGSSSWINAHFVRLIAEKFKLTHTRQVDRVLGLDVREHCDGTTRTLSVDTSQFVSDLADEHDLAGQAAVDNPVTSNPGYEFWGATDAKERDYYLENKRFRALTGSINYCACIGRPDIAHAASMVAKFNNNPGPKAYAAAKRIVAYLVATKDRALTWTGHARKPVPWKHIALEVYVDSDHMGAGERSQTGVAAFLVDDRAPQSRPGGVVDWQSKRQGCLTEFPEPPDPLYAEDDAVAIAAHSSDAELIALSDVVPKARHLRLLLRELGATQGRPTQVRSDSQPALNFVHADTSPSLKHMNARVRQVREMLRLGILSYGHVKGSENPADALTKRLTAAVFNVHACTLLGVLCLMGVTSKDRASRPRGGGGAA